MVRAAEPQELDIHALLRQFVGKVDSGAPATYATFRETWQQMKFSLIYEGCKERHLSQDYISWLLAAASDHFWAPLPEGSSKSKSGDAIDAPAPAALDVSGSDILVQGVPSTGEATEATERVLATVLEDAEHVEPSRPGRMHSMPEEFMQPQLGGSGLHHEGAPLSPTAEGAARPSGPGHFDVAGQPQAVPLDERSLLAMLMDNDDMDALEPDQHILAALEAPSGSNANRVAGQDGDGVPSFALKTGALYTIYTIHKTQPAYQGRQVRAYLPVSSLRAISNMLPEARQRHIPDVPAIVKLLVREQAFVVGGVRRPPAGHQIVRDGPVRMAQVDMSERNAMQPMTMRHLANTQLALRELKHVQLLCDSYSKAQRSVFAATNPEDMPPSIADLGMGERFRDLARQITLDVHGVLSGDAPQISRRQKIADQKAAQAGAAAAGVQVGDTRTVSNSLARAPAGEVRAQLADMDLSGLPSMAKAVERKRGLEQAEILSKQREWAERGARALAAAEDMPDDLGHPARQEPPAAAAAMAALDSLGVTLPDIGAAAAEEGGQLPESPAMGAVAPKQDHSRNVHRSGPLNGTGQPTKRRNRKIKGDVTAAQAMASVFGDDNGSSSADNVDLDTTPVVHLPEHSEQQADHAPGEKKVLSRPKHAIVQKTQGSERRSKRGAESRDKAALPEATVPPRAKRMAAVAEQGAEHAGSARPNKRVVTASKESKHSKAGRSADRSKGRLGKPVIKAAGVPCQRAIKQPEKVALEQKGAAAVDWKAYADDLDARMAEAEALLADDSV